MSRRTIFSHRLLYGKHAHGPLDILRQQWLPTKKTPRNTSEWILNLREMLSEIRDTAIANQEEAKNLYNQRHDKDRYYPNGTKVLVFSPIFTGKRVEKLNDRWQGLYTILGKIRDIPSRLPDRTKRHRTVHVMAIKHWVEPTLPIDHIKTIDNHISDIPDYRNDSETDNPILDQSLTQDLQRQLQDILKEFFKVATSNIGLTAMTVHEIVTNEALPMRLHHYECPIAWHDQFVQELYFLKEKNFIVPSTSPWVSPMFAVPKKRDDIHLVVNYRRLNDVTIPDPYVMPRSEVQLDVMGKANIYSKLDLKKGYYQVPVAPHHRDKTSILLLCISGLAMLHQHFKGCWMSSCKVRQSLQDAISKTSAFSVRIGLTISCISVKFFQTGESWPYSALKKNTFGSDNCEFLGHQVGSGKINPQTAKTEAAAKYQQPRTKPDIRSFLGLAGYYRWYIPNFSAIAAPLADCTKTSASEKIEWTEDCKKSFGSLKKALTSKPTLVPPNYSNQFILHTDASNRGIGAVLSQVKSKRRQDAQ